MRPSTIKQLKHNDEKALEAAFALQSDRIAKRRRHNPTRDARRQAHLTRQRTRIEMIPMYQDIINYRGEVTRAKYLGHYPQVLDTRS